MSQAVLTTFAAIREHQRACSYLRHAAADRLPHALLFAGPDGVGKKSVALALSAWLQCSGGAADACGTCSACRQVAAGTHPDLQLVSVAPGKKEIGVDRIREVKRFVQLRPLHARCKVVVIDDAHRLTVAAQNALLKTLEEPPDHSFLVLIVNNPDAMLPTVRSRCQRVHFSPLTPGAVVDVLVNVCGVDPTLAPALAALAEGSPGHALALQACLAGTSREQLIAQLAGVGEARYVRVMQLANALSQPETQVAGKLEILLSHYRDVAEGAAAALQPGAARAAVQCADAINAAAGALRRSTPNRQLLLEALLLRVTRSC